MQLHQLQSILAVRCWRVMERTHRVIALPPPLCDVAIAIIDSSVPAPRPDPSRLGQPSRRPAITRSWPTPARPRRSRAAPSHTISSSSRVVVRSTAVPARQPARRRRSNFRAVTAAGQKPVCIRLLDSRRGSCAVPRAGPTDRGPPTPRCRGQPRPPVCNKNGKLQISSSAAATSSKSRSPGWHYRAAAAASGGENWLRRGPPARAPVSRLQNARCASSSPRGGPRTPQAAVPRS